MTKSKVTHQDEDKVEASTVGIAPVRPAEAVYNANANVDIEKTAPRAPDRFRYSGKYKWIKRGRTLTSYAVRFQTKHIDNLDWTPIFVGLLVFCFLIFGLIYLFARYFTPLGIYIVQRDLLGPRKS